MSEPDWAGVNRILMRSAKKYAPVSTVRFRRRCIHGRKSRNADRQRVNYAVAFGRDWIANPDLVARLQAKLSLIHSVLKVSMAAVRKAHGLPDAIIQHCERRKAAAIQNNILNLLAILRI